MSKEEREKLIKSIKEHLLNGGTCTKGSYTVYFDRDKIEMMIKSNENESIRKKFTGEYNELKINNE